MHIHVLTHNTALSLSRSHSLIVDVCCTVRKENSGQDDLLVEQHQRCCERSSRGVVKNQKQIVYYPQLVAQHQNVIFQLLQPVLQQK